MLDKLNRKNESSPNATTPVIISRTFGVWKILTIKEQAMSLEQMFLKEWNKYTSAVPYVFRLLRDIYHVNPPLVLLYLASRAWNGIEPGIIINTFIQRLTSQVELFFEEDALREELRYDVYTRENLKTLRPGPWMGWSYFSEIIRAIAGVLGLFTIVTSILYQHHGGTVFTTLCLLYPIVDKIAGYQRSQAMMIVADNKDYVRLKALGRFGGWSQYREDIVNNNIADHIMNEYKNSRQRLGSLFTGEPMREIRLKDPIWLELFSSISDEVPVLYFTCCALLDPSSHSMSALAILHQQSSTLTRSLHSTFYKLSSILSSLEAIKNLYHVEPLRLLDGTVDYQPPSDTKGISFQFRNVSFSYPGSQSNDDALRNISVDIKAGQLVVIVGANGSGKSTLIRLLTRTYDVTSGELLLDCLPIQTYKIASLRNISSTLSQDHLIWPLSLAENVGLGYAACAKDEEMINTAVEKGGASSVVARMSDGLATVLYPVRSASSFGIELPQHQALQDILDRTELNSDVSGGEKQRLVASRTFMRLRDPKIRFVAVDEPSSALDPRGELELFNGLRAEQDGRTMVFVTHRFGHLTKHADLIICMKDGKIAESGSHKDLLALQGEYATLYNIQAQAFTSNPNSG
ncbi:hypothetical protein C0992_009202, partial [Termitomyces sp. T32_za158]